MLARMLFHTSDVTGLAPASKLDAGTTRRGCRADLMCRPPAGEACRVCQRRGLLTSLGAWPPACRLAPGVATLRRRRKIRRRRGRCSRRSRRLCCGQAQGRAGGAPAPGARTLA